MTDIFITLFGIKELYKLWKKTFKPSPQLSCFVGHPVTYKPTKFILSVYRNIFNHILFSHLKSVKKALKPFLPKHIKYTNKHI